MTSKIYEPSHQQKVAATDAIHYEFIQYLRVRLLTVSPTENQKELRNAIIESRLAHFRILLDFLKNSRRARSRPGGPVFDDILAADYGFDPREMEFDTIDFRNRLDKGLAHLRYTRIKARDTGDWPWEAVNADLLPCMVEFARFLLRQWVPEDRTRDWENLLQELQQSIQLPGEGIRAAKVGDRRLSLGTDLINMASTAGYTGPYHAERGSERPGIFLNSETLDPESGDDQ